MTFDFAWFCLLFFLAPAPNPLASASNGYDYKNVSTRLITVQFLKEENKTKKIKQTMVKKDREKPKCSHDSLNIIKRIIQLETHKIAQWIKSLAGHGDLSSISGSHVQME